MFKSKIAVLVGGVIVAVAFGAVVIYYLSRPHPLVPATCVWDSQKFGTKRCSDCTDPSVKNSVARGPFTIGGILYYACCPLGYEPTLKDNVIICVKSR